MALFSAMFPQERRQPAVAGGSAPRNPYNVPTNQIRAPGNTVNINAGGGNQGDAFAAFSRLYTPMLQNNIDLLRQTGATPAGGPIDTRLGAAPPQQLPQYGPQDISNALRTMFQRAEDIGTVSRYSGFSPQMRRSQQWG